VSLKWSFCLKFSKVSGFKRVLGNLMYIDYYGFTKQPFQTTPDADFLFLSPSHKEALASIIYGIEQRKGFIAITGEVGVGKTLILRSYLETVEKTKQKTIYIFNPSVTFESLLITILKELGVTPVSGQATEMVTQLHELSIAEYRNGGVVVLVIDEAQNIPAETLEGIRMLSNLETSTEKLVQIVLVGQPELEALLDRHDLRQVRERIAVHARILPLTKAESFAYIDHRLAHAGVDERPIFSKDALDLIVNTAKGIPRRLNIICDSALITGFGYQQSTISRKIAKEVIADFRGPGFLDYWKGRSAYTLAALLTMALPVIVYLGIGMKAPGISVSVAAPEVKQVEPKSEQKPASEAEGTMKNPGSSENAKTPGNSETINGTGSSATAEKPTNSGITNGAGISATAEKPANSGTTKSAGSSEMVTTESAELAETARLLTVLLDSGRVVVGKMQPTINNPRLEHKGFSSSAFEAQLRSQFLSRTGHDLRNLAPASMPERAKPLLVRLAFFMQKAVQDVQPLINKKGIGFKGFIPATFGTNVAAQFSKDTGLKLRQIGPPSAPPRNPDNKPDEQEEQALQAIQRSHPRIGDHAVEQRLPDFGVRVILPLFYTKQCLGCHGKPKGEIDISGYPKEGYKEGDLGGAITVILPGGKRISKGD
jgi:type II secretory pathway predicted ATPase ExeA